jgi:hypothetical protein
VVADFLMVRTTDPNLSRTDIPIMIEIISIPDLTDPSD